MQKGCECEKVSTDKESKRSKMAEFDKLTSGDLRC